MKMPYGNVSKQATLIVGWGQVQDVAKELTTLLVSPFSSDLSLLMVCQHSMTSPLDCQGSERLWFNPRSENRLQISAPAAPNHQFISSEYTDSGRRDMEEYNWSLHSYSEAKKIKLITFHSKSCFPG